MSFFFNRLDLQLFWPLLNNDKDNIEISKYILSFKKNLFHSKGVSRILVKRYTIIDPLDNPQTIANKLSTSKYV